MTDTTQPGADNAQTQAAMIEDSWADRYETGVKPWSFRVPANAPIREIADAMQAELNELRPLIALARRAAQPVEPAVPAVGGDLDERALFMVDFRARHSIPSSVPDSTVWEGELPQDEFSGWKARAAFSAGTVDGALVALTSDEMAALRRFYECATDGEGYDVPKAMMSRLSQIGVVRRVSGAHYSTTDYGLAVLDAAPTGSAAAPADLATIKAVQEYIVDVVRAFGAVSCAAYISTWHRPEAIANTLRATSQPIPTGNGDTDKGEA